MHDLWKRGSGRLRTVWNDELVENRVVMHLEWEMIRKPVLLGPRGRTAATGPRQRRCVATQRRAAVYLLRLPLLRVLLR